MELKTLGERIRYARSNKGMTQAELAKAVGMSQPALHNTENGRNKGTTKIIEFSRALGVSPEWLLFGTNEDDNGTIAKDQLSPWGSDTPVDDDEVEVPFLKEVCLSAGNGFEVMTDYEGRKLRFAKKLLRELSIRPENVVCVTISGDSMEPVFKDGSTVGINTGVNTIKDGDVYAINNGGLLQIKRLKRLSANEVLIESYNPDYDPIQKNLDEELVVIGRVFWHSTVF